MSSNLETVQGIYAAFRRGDVPAILEQLSPDIDWEYTNESSPVPWLAPGKGLEHVGGFFQTFMSQVEVEHFAPKRLMADGDLVVAICDIKFKVKATGKRVVEVDEPHLWHFDADGKVTKFRHAADTYNHFRALQPD